MRSLIAALLAFTLLFVAHLALWRIRRPPGQYVVLPVLSLAVLAVSTGCFYAILLAIPTLKQFVPISPVDYFNFVTLYLALDMAYFVTYPAVQADSPSLTIVLLIKQAEPMGLTLKDLTASLNDEVLVKPRLDDLLAGNLVRCDAGRYVIGPSGALLAKIHLSYRALLKMEKGG